MKILHFIDIFDFSLGGIVQFVFQQVRALAQHDQQVTLVAGQGTDLPESWRHATNGQYPVAIELTGKPGIQGRLSSRQLHQFIDLARQSDIVHLHGTWILGNVQIARQLVRLKKPIIVSTHGMLDDWSLSQKSIKKQIFLQLFGKRYIRRAARVHCTAAAERQQVIKNLGFEPPITIIPPIIELPAWGDSHRTELLSTELGLATTAPRIVFLSRLLPNKGPEILLDALALVKQQGQVFQAIMVGPGEESYVQGLRNQAQRLGLQGDVHWLGMQREPYKTACYRESDVYVLPTIQENFGIVLVEAMAMGLPIVTTRGTDVWQELESRGATIVDRSAAAIAGAIRETIHSLDACRERAATSAQQVRQWLDPIRVCKEYLKMYQQALSDQPRSVRS